VDVLVHVYALLHALKHPGTIFYLEFFIPVELLLALTPEFFWIFEAVEDRLAYHIVS